MYQWKIILIVCLKMTKIRLMNNINCPGGLWVSQTEGGPQQPYRGQKRGQKACGGGQGSRENQPQGRDHPT